MRSEYESILLFSLRYGKINLYFQYRGDAIYELGLLNKARYKKEFQKFSFYSSYIYS